MRMVSGILLFFISLQVMANEAAIQAAEAYKLRDYSPQGIAAVQESIALYNQAIASEADTKLRLYFQNEQASAYYFLGSALMDKDSKMQNHQNAMNVANQIMGELGVNAQNIHELSQAQITALLNKLDEEQEVILAESMYTKGISLAQWGSLKGVASSIGKLPEVLGLMDRIEWMGFAAIHEYGPYRTIGRINFMLPAPFGGNLEKSEDYLKRATQNTLAEGQKYSANGFNNLYFAETLYKLGKETQAKRLLEMFIQADPSTLTPGKEPENREALKAAKELYDQWNK